MLILHMVPDRKYKRVGVIGLARVKPKALFQPVEGHIANISEGGLALYVQELIQGKLEVQLIFEGLGKWFDVGVTGAVAWHKKVGHSYAIGVEFDPLDARKHHHTLSFLKEYGKIS